MSLFTTCLTISFLVVGAPHILPCPVDRRQFAEDGSGEPRKRRRRKTVADTETETAPDSNNLLDMQDVSRHRECPVPKPGGLIAQVMGLRQEETEAPSVIVRSLRDKHHKSDEVS